MSTVTAEQVEKVVRDALESFGAETEGVTLETTFEELDVDSLDLAELSQIVEEQYGVVLKGDDMKQIASVGDAVSMIVERT
ncbi:MAG: acyl carrier protein [Solirubrobacteraceae bacterium]|nr:acyl carrier protein [Solirubrobacteraceae bacterium]